MKNNYIVGAVISAAVMILLPWAAVNAAGEAAGMIVSILLLYVIDPMYLAAVGYAAGKRIGERWGLPVIAAVLFLLGAWLVMGMDADAFVMYTLIYLAIGVIAMVIMAFHRKRSTHKI